MKAEKQWEGAMENVRDNPANLKLLQDWMRSYKPKELFDAHGTLDVAVLMFAAQSLGGKPRS